MKKKSTTENSLVDIVLRNRRRIFLVALLLIGFFIRFYYADKFVKESGDLRLYADWGEKFWEYGSKNFYFVKEWYYAPPNYPPILSLIYAGSYWLFDHKYVLAQIHNATRLVPAVFIIYFYDHGYYLLLKLPGIMADLGLAFLIYKVVFELTKNTKRSLIAFSFYLFNPTSIFFSGAWGQTDSLVSLFGILSFLVLFSRYIWLSIPLLFISFYIKPNWGLFIPLYLFILFGKKPKFKYVGFGIIMSVIIFIVTTLPFSQGSVLSFSKYLLESRILPTASITHKASVSAFNFHTIFFEIDRTSDEEPVLGIPANIFGIIIFILVNVVSFWYSRKQKYNIKSLMVALFLIGVSGYLFLTNMLERYFFAGFVPLIIIGFTNTRLLVYLLLINLATFLNLVYAFFRRSVGEIADLFTENDFLAIRVLSTLNLFGFVILLKKFNPISFKKS